MLLNGLYGMNITRAVNITGSRYSRLVIPTTLYYILYYYIIIVVRLWCTVTIKISRYGTFHREILYNY